MPQLNSFFFEKYHQTYAKITIFSVFKRVPQNLVLCMSQNLRTTKNAVQSRNSILHGKSLT